MLLISYVGRGFGDACVDVPLRPTHALVHRRRHCFAQTDELRGQGLTETEPLKSVVKLLPAQPHWHPSGMEKAFQFVKPLHLIVKDGRGQGCVSVTLIENLEKIHRLICPARRNQGHGYAV